MVFERRESGQTTLEYMILIAVLSIAILFILAWFSDEFRDALWSLSGELATNLTNARVN